jgi:endo-1,4-beta-xylanase
MLCALAAGKNRHLIMVTGITSEGWNNTEGQCLAFAASQPAWDLLGCGEQNNMIIHLDGHAVLPSDLEQILDYCDIRLPGIQPENLPDSLPRMRADLFLTENRDVLDPLFA